MFRIRKSHEDSKVFFVELFFDLVFVYAITQISHYFFQHFTLQGLAETIFLLLAVWWVWIFNAWVTNWLDPRRILVQLLLFALMLVGLGLSVSIPFAFHESARQFAVCYTLMQVGRSLFMCFALFKQRNRNYYNFVSITLWLTLSSIFWITGALAELPARYMLWCIALTIEYLSPIVGFWTPVWGRFHSVDWNISGSHMTERCALFVILSLGESLLETGATFAEQQWGMNVVEALLVSFSSMVAMWWLYFATGVEYDKEDMNINMQAKWEDPTPMSIFLLSWGLSYQP